MLRKLLMLLLPLAAIASPVSAQEALPAPAALPPVVAAQPAAVSDPAAPVSKIAVPAEENILYLDLSTGGRVTIQLFAEQAPRHVARIKNLARQGFYDGVVFHRVIEGFMAQTGDPTGTGMGGSELPDLKAEFHPFPHLRGVVSMARSESEDSANSQFFIVFYPRFALDNKYTPFGRVTSGMEYVDVIKRGEPPTSPSRILQASVAIDGKAPPVSGSFAALTEKEITLDDLNAPIKP